MAREIVNWRYDKYRTIEHQYVLIGKTFKFDRDIKSSHRVVFKAYRTTNNTNRKNVRYSRCIKYVKNRVIQGVYRVGIIDPFAYMCLTEHE